jgi:hypothetical protein
MSNFSADFSVFRILIYPVDERGRRKLQLASDMLLDNGQVIPINL